MNIHDMRKKKKEMGLSNAKISELSGIPLGTVQKVFSGATETPRYDTLQKLEQMFIRIAGTGEDQGKGSGRTPGSSSGTGRNGASSYVSESAVPAYETKSQEPEKQGKQQGEYTLEDYYNMPDDRRVELIDGVIYDMASPTSQHQLALNYINIRISIFIESTNASCTVYIPPFDVQLDCDNKTMVQPDLSILCDKTKDTGKNILGAPDFVLEVLSPSTRQKDMTIKYNKFKNAGVREYWILDCESKSLIVYDFDHESFGKIFREDDIVPISVLAGKCKINLKELFKIISN